MKKTTNEIIRNRKVKQQSPLVSGLLRLLINPLYNRPCSVKYIRNVDMKKYKHEPLLVLVNHASRFDYAFVQGALGRRKYNFVAAEQEFHRTKFKLVFHLGHAIPKKSFVPDLNAIKGIATILNKTKNGCVAICPCGLSTVGGAQQPIIPGVGKMVQHFGVRVLTIRIYGAYLVCPKFDLKERHGHVEVVLDELFSPDQLNRYTADEIDLKINEALYTDDYEWNALRQHSYKRKDGRYAENMEQILYKCPKCGTEMEMSGHDNVIECKHCGNGATLDNKYNLEPIGSSVIPYNPREWYDWERREMRRAVKDPDFFLEEHVTLGMQPKYGYVKHGLQAYDVGEGTLRMDRKGLSYKGTRDGEPWETFIPSDRLYTTIINMDGSFLATYAGGEFLQFTPDRFGAAIRMNFAIEEVHRENGGKWRNFPWFNYDKQGFETK